jgi:hypothetical protein
MSSRPPRVEPVRPARGKRIAAILGVIALIAVAFTGGFLLANHSSSQRVDKAPFKGFPGTNGGSTTTVSGGSTGPKGSTTSTTIYRFGAAGIQFTGGEVIQKDPTVPYSFVNNDTGKQATGTTAPHTLPAIVSISSTKNLTDGQAIAIHVTPKTGSAMYGYEVRICAPNAVFKVEYDFYPNQTGNCALYPLSADSDNHVVSKADPPYKVADATFRVGVGTSTYTDLNGKHVSFTCGPGHPCQLVLLLQVPYGFGFATYKLSYK